MFFTLEHVRLFLCRRTRIDDIALSKGEVHETSYAVPARPGFHLLNRSCPTEIRKAAEGNLGYLELRRCRPQRF